ncbi:MAG TPA: alpha/beta fold hydrolase [Caldimonas sp.]|nr:alpha/beta fold hydrolase [Caldimonas sp.]
MLARLQQLIAALLLAVALAAAAIGALRGPAWLGPAFVALVLIGYAGVLAIEFVWLRASYAAGDDVRPTAAQLAHAWLLEVVAAPQVFLWRQPFRWRSEPDHLPADARGRRGVLFVHGFFCNRGLWNTWLRRLRRRDVPFIAVSLEPIFGSIDDYRPTIAESVARLHEATGLAPLIVAHSMGGLAARAWLASQPEASIHRLVTIASPHAGTRLGAHGRGANIRQMRLGSDWLARLATSETVASRVRFTCFWGHCDNIVFPTRSATLEGADNRHLPVTPHVQMVEHPAIFNEVLRIVAAPPDAPR